MFYWKEECETGNAVVDNQHKKLFEIGNSAYELLKNEIYADKYDRIVDIIHELKDYTVYHFQAEEEYMLKSGFKGFFSHKVEHDDFIEKFDHIDYNRIDQGQNDYILEILNFVAEWITQHILVKDKQHSHKI
jgi:hemerythrin